MVDLRGAERSVRTESKRNTDRRQIQVGQISQGLRSHNGMLASSLNRELLYIFLRSPSYCVENALKELEGQAEIALRGCCRGPGEMVGDMSWRIQ